MPKSRSEIQKAYRERQKAKSASFLEKEKIRQTLYRIPASKLSDKKRKARNHKNKLRNRLSRLRKRQERERNARGLCETSGDKDYPIINENNPGKEQIEQPSTSSTSQNRLIVKFPYRSEIVKKVNARALSRAHRTITSLNSEIASLKRKMRTKSKQIERLSKMNQKCYTHQLMTMTPKKKTTADIKELRLTPRREKIVRKQLLTGNVLMQEIHEAKLMSGKKKVNTIHRIISGSLAKKYRCLKSIGSSVQVCRRALSKTDNKQLSFRREQRQSLSKVAEQSVIEFFNREDNSRTQPGKADAKRVEGKKEKEQTKVLTDYLKNLHDKYIAECPDKKISLSTFARLRPSNVLLASFISRNTCQCIHHQNMALKIQSLRKTGLRISENPENLFIHRDDLAQLLSTLPEKITYRVWQKVDIGNGKSKMQIVEKEEERDIFKEGLVKQLNVFEEHVHRVREQYSQVRRLKDNLPEDEVMVQMDFAENFSCRSLNEVQTAYWNQTMVTIHPVVAYYKDMGELRHQSYVVVSDEMSHSSATVCAFLDKVIPELKTIKPQLKRVHYWTDSPSSQYRNRYIFHVIANHHTLYHVHARWNYFEVGHGKGPCDGLGGTAKRMADMAIRQGHTQIQNAEEFYNWGINSSMSAKFLFVGSNTTQLKQVDLQDIQTKPLKGTMKLHAVGLCGDNGAFMTRDTSCYCQTCLTGSFCSSWKIEKIQYKVTKVTPNTSCVSDHDHPAPSGPDDVPSMPSQGNGNRNEINEGVKKQQLGKDISMKDIDIGNEVAVTYEKAWFVGKIMDKDDKDCEFEVKFMERAKEMFRWPRYEDRLWVKDDQVLCILSSLTPSGKSGRLFKLSQDERSLVEDLFKSMQILDH